MQQQPFDVVQATSLYRRAASIPTIKSASISDDEADPSCLHISWLTDTLDFENNGKITTERSATVLLGEVEAARLPTARVLKKSSGPTVVDAKGVGSTSPSTKKRFFVGPNGSAEDLVLVVVDQTGVAQRIPVDKKHGAVFPSPFFQNVTWSRDESKVLYVAERITTPGTKVWAAKPSAATATTSVDSTLSAFETKQTFGEALKDFSALSIFVADFATGKIREIVPEAFSAANWLSNPVFVNGDESVWFVAAGYFPQKLGLAHCATRPNQLYETRLPKDGDDAELPSPQPVAFPDGVECLRNLRVRGTTVVATVPSFGCRAHSCAYSLWVIDSVTKAFKCIVPIVDVADSDWNSFHGLYSCTGSDVFWVSDERILFQTPHRSACVVYDINLMTCQVTRLVPSVLASVASDAEVGNLNVLDVRGSFALLAHSTTLAAPVLILHDLTSTEGASRVLDDSGRAKQRDLFPATQISTTIVRLGAAHHDTEMLLHRHARTSDVRGTVFFVHGGPHASDSNAFMVNFQFLLAAGFNVISVNYGGSVGFGQRRIDELLGFIGTNDVSDCMAALHAAAPEGPLAVSGGSHGGFLAAHLSGRYPDTFQVSIMRNPVINNASNFWETDISDWCLAEVGVTAANVQKFYDCSPIQYAGSVKAATLIGIGLDDMRVPPPQGRAWYYGIRQGQVGIAEGARAPVRMLEYPGTGHAMDSPQSSIDFQVHALLFMQAHMSGAQR